MTSSRLVKNRQGEEAKRINKRKNLGSEERMRKNRRRRTEGDALGGPARDRDAVKGRCAEVRKIASLCVMV